MQDQMNLQIPIKPGSVAFREAGARRYLEGWLTDDRGRAMWAYILYVRDSVRMHDPYRYADTSNLTPHQFDALPTECLMTLRTAFDQLANTSWELCELWNFMLPTRYYSGNKWGASRGFGTHEADSLREYCSLVKRITEQNLLPHRPIPWRKLFCYEPPSMETLKQFRLVYHPCGLLVPDSYPGGLYVPPCFRGEEHLEFIKFYNNGGI